MNKVILRGNLTRDVELKETQRDSVVARFGIAIRRNFKNDDGEYDADFLNCVAYGKLAETIGKYFHKGSGIIIIGRLQSYSYENENNERKSGINVVIESIEFDRVNSEKKETKEERTDAEIVADVVNNPFDLSEQIQLGDSDLPF